MTYGAPEARLAEMLKEFEAALPENIRLAYLPSFGVIKLRLTGTGKDREILKKQVDEQVRNLSSIIPDLIFSEKEDTFESVLGLLLLERKETMCTAESCTGGNIAHMITTIPGSSYYFKGSVVAYSNAVKEKLLGVDSKIIEEEGAVSEPAESCGRGSQETAQYRLCPRHLRNSRTRGRNGRKTCRDTLDRCRIRKRHLLGTVYLWRRPHHKHNAVFKCSDESA
jgi:hypothetical protein